MDILFPGISVIAAQLQVWSINDLHRHLMSALYSLHNPAGIHSEGTLTLIFATEFFDWTV